MISTSDEGTSFCTQCEAYARAAEQAHAQGFREGIEKAAKVAESRVTDRYSSDTAVEAGYIVTEIRSLLPSEPSGEGKGGSKE